MMRSKTGMAMRIGMAAAAAFVGLAPLTGQGPAPGGDVDQALALIRDAKRNYTSAVRDYTCVFVSRENIKGRVNEDQYTQFKFRQSPFSVYMKWLAPQRLAGQEVCYVAGKNNNRLRAHSRGILGVAGFLSLDLDDPRVREHSKHSITEAGIGNLIDRTVAAWEADKRSGKSVTRIAEFDFDNRRCYRVESIRSERTAYAYRSVIYLEKNSKYPLRNENYTWPAAGGAPSGELMESFSYTNLQFNVGLAEADFAK